jgi:hypothetical protein
MECQESRGNLSASVRRPVTWDFSALGGTRTPNLLIRSQMLYPIELRALVGTRRDYRAVGRRRNRKGPVAAASVSWSGSTAAHRS